MTGKELKKLKKDALIQLLLEQAKREEELRRELNKTTDKNENLPETAEIEELVKRKSYIRRYLGVFRSTVFILITVAAVSVLVATLFLPVLQIYGTSMTPSLVEDDIVVSIKNYSFHQGDIVSFYYNNKILVKRVLAFPGDWVNIDEVGNVYVNDVKLDEPYVQDKALGECDIELPYQVPDGRYFVCGDHRSTSLDSRSTTIGCISEEQLVGKIVFRLWPIKHFGSVK